MSGVGSSFMKIWTCGSSPPSWPRNAWTRIKNVNGASRLSNFWNFFGAIQMISCRDWWTWTKPGYITMTRRNSNNKWSGGIVAHSVPKIPGAKIRWKGSHLNFLGSRRHLPHLISSKGPNYQRGDLVISVGATEGHFQGKTPRQGHQGGSVLAQQCPGSPDNCDPQETGLSGLPMSWSPTLFSGSGPVGLPPVPWTGKTIESSPFFVRRGSHCCRGDLVGRTNFYIFLSGLQKLQQLAKKCIKLRGEYFE